MELRLQEMKRDTFNPVVGTIITILVAGSLLIVSVFVYSKFTGSLDTSGFSTAENTTYESIKENILDGYDMAGIIIVVLVLVAVISVFMSLGR